MKYEIKKQKWYCYLQLLKWKLQRFGVESRRKGVQVEKRGIWGFWQAQLPYLPQHNRLGDLNQRVILHGSEGWKFKIGGQHSWVLVRVHTLAC